MKIKKMRVPSWMFWPLVCTVAFFFCYVMFNGTLFHFPPDILGSDANNFRIAVALNLSSDTEPKTVQNFTCSASDSTEDIPPNIDEPFQDFLRYRHCREFPTLLTPSPCEDDLYLLLAVKSTGAQVDRRAAVRETWGHAGLIQGRRVKLIFLMGRSIDEVMAHNPQTLLEWENHRHGDILQWDFVDRFFNLSRKEDRFLSWYSQSCSSAQFVFKGDDDMFVNTENLVRFLMAHNPENHMLTGQIHQRTFPERHKGIKYYIPVEMYPNKPYPPFPSGGGYLMSRQTMLGLAMAAQRVKLFPLDDVYLGMCLEEMGLTLTHHNGFMTFGLDRGQNRFDPCVYHDIMVMHTLNPVELRVMWGLMHDNSLPCVRVK